MKKTLPIIITLILVLGISLQSNFDLSSWAQSTGSDVQNAYQNNQSDIQVTGKGQVIKILSDDTKGLKHQRFILKLTSGITVLIAHNIDLAPRIKGIKTGADIEFYGEYEWNKKGGVVHWTHHDPAGGHPGGWLKHQGQIYQ